MRITRRTSMKGALACLLAPGLAISGTIDDEVPNIINWDSEEDFPGKATVHLDGVAIAHVLWVDFRNLNKIKLCYVVHDKNDCAVLKENGIDLLRKTLTGRSLIVLFADGRQIFAPAVENR